MRFIQSIAENKPSVIDLTVTYLIPLFYAGKNHKQLFANFLKSHSSGGVYLKFCQELATLLMNAKDNLRQSQKEIDRQIAEVTQAIKEQEAHQASIESVPLELTEFDDEQWFEQNLASRQLDTTTQPPPLYKRRVTLVQENTSLKNRIARLSEDEYALFQKEMRLFCVSGRENYIQLRQYLRSRANLIDLIMANEMLLKIVGSSWIDFAMEWQLKESKPPTLPTYLFPFNAKDPSFETVIVYKTLEKTSNEKSNAITESTYQKTLIPFNQHIKFYMKNNCVLLLEEITHIQSKYFDNEFEPIANENVPPMLICQKVFSTPISTPKETPTEENNNNPLPLNHELN